MNLYNFYILIFMVLSYGEAFSVQKASFCELRSGIKLQSTCDGCKSFYSRPVKERILLNAKTRRSLKKNCKIVSRCCNLHSKHGLGLWVAADFGQIRIVLQLHPWGWLLGFMTFPMLNFCAHCAIEIYQIRFFFIVEQMPGWKRPKNYGFRP